MAKKLHARTWAAVLVAPVFAVSLLAAGPVYAEGTPTKVVMRIASDVPPPPNAPAGVAIQRFAERLPEVIPGSEARVYFTGALYTAPQAFEAMRQGTLEMSWMQAGKVASVEPLAMTVVGPGVLTTVGAVNSIEQISTYKMLIDRLHKVHQLKVFGVAHMSFGMGAGGTQRYRAPADFTGRKIRSMGPVENASLTAWKANPVVMGYGDVPSSLQSGVIDGLLTSIGGWLGVREQAPFFSMGGPGAFVGDYYLVAASERWWDKLTPATQGALQKLITESIEYEKAINWCIDKMSYDKYGTKDPSKPGIYWLSTAEVEKFVDASGDGPTRYIKTKVPQTASRWVDAFVTEGRELTKKHPAGSSPIEQIDCTKYASTIKIK